MIRPPAGLCAGRAARFHADYRAGYRKEAADDAWNRMQAWLRKYKVLT
jgi:carboxymethylenebutenolidase